MDQTIASRQTTAERNLNDIEAQLGIWTKDALLTTYVGNPPHLTIVHPDGQLINFNCYGSDEGLTGGDCIGYWHQNSEDDDDEALHGSSCPRCQLIGNAWGPKTWPGMWDRELDEDELNSIVVYIVGIYHMLTAPR